MQKGLCYKVKLSLWIHETPKNWLCLKPIPLNKLYSGRVRSYFSIYFTLRVKFIYIFCHALAMFGLERCQMK